MKSKIIQHIFFILLPCLFFWFFLFYCLFNGIELQFSGFFGDFYESYMEPLNSLSESINDPNSYAMAELILLIVLWPVPVIYFLIFGLALFIMVPVYFFIDGIYIDNLLVWLCMVFMVLAIIGGCSYGKWIETETHYSDPYLEAEMQDDGKVKISKKDGRYEISHGKENFGLFILKFIGVVVGGVVVFIVLVKKLLNGNADTPAEK